MGDGFIIVIVIVVVLAGTTPLWVPWLFHKNVKKCPYCGRHEKKRTTVSYPPDGPDIFWRKEEPLYEFHCGTQMKGEELLEPGRWCEVATKVWEAAKRKYAPEEKKDGPFVIPPKPSEPEYWGFGGKKRY